MRAWAAAAACALACGCGINVEGDFKGIPFTPDATTLVFANRHELLVRDGAVIPVKKNKSAQTIDVFLSAAYVDVTEDWRTLPSSELLEYKRQIAKNDSLVLQGLRLGDFEQRDPLKATLAQGELEGDFDFAVGQSAPADDLVAEQGLGARVTVTVTPKELEVEPRGGDIAMEIEVKREREAGQRGDVATGTVTISFSSGLYAERLSDANFGVAAPIVYCMQERGPDQTGACRNVAPFATVDETGPVE
jgi:hypothetical protein